MSDVRPARSGPVAGPDRDGDKKQARARVNREVMQGRRPHPNSLPCSSCGAVWEEGKPRHEYHHHNGYGVGFHGDVIPICCVCHHALENPRALQTHCHKGHEFTPENTFRKSNGTRGCRECRREYDRNRKRPDGYWRAVNARRRRPKDGG